MLARDVKPSRRLQTANAQPASFCGGTNLSNRRMRTRMYGGVAGEERRLSPYADSEDLQGGSVFSVAVRFHGDLHILIERHQEA